MKFKIDENLPGDVAIRLQKADHDAVTVRDQSLSGCTDDKIAGVCRQEERILMTLDLDFADIRLYPPEECSGLVVLRPLRQDMACVMNLLERIIPLLETERVHGCLWIVEEGQVRIRSQGV